MKIKPKLMFLGFKRSSLKKLFFIKHIFYFRDHYLNQKSLRQIFNEYPVHYFGDFYSILILNYGTIYRLRARKFPASDIEIFNQIFVEECYRPLVNSMKSVFLGSESVRIIDAGANVGYFSAYILMHFKNAKIVALEPDKGNYTQVEKNMEDNNWSINLLIGGIWPRSGYLNISSSFRDNRTASLITLEVEEITPIRAYTFENILTYHSWSNVDCLKLDIEGAERFLFAEPDQSDFILKRLKFLAIEIHDEFNIREKILSHLERNGFEYFNSGDLTIAVKTGLNIIDN